MSGLFLICFILAVAFGLSLALNFGFAKVLGRQKLPNKWTLGLVPLLVAVAFGTYLYFFVFADLYPWTRAGLFYMFPFFFLILVLISGVAARALRVHSW